MKIEAFRLDFSLISKINVYFLHYSSKYKYLHTLKGRNPHNLPLEQCGFYFALQFDYVPENVWMHLVTVRI